MDIGKQSVVKTMNHLTENTHCLACGSTDIHTALDLGQQPLANSYKDSADEPEDRYPLSVSLCHQCFHLQLSHTVDPEIIYKNYLYATGTNQTIKDYCKWFADFCLEYCTEVSNVLDIGCNDGTQLNYFKKEKSQQLQPINTYGIDPAENLFLRSSANHSVICDFFGPDAVAKLKKVKYDIIIAQNVFAHNPNPYEFIASCAELMTDNTVLFIQTSQADMVLNNEFDTIYHEHVNFFNVNSMSQLAQRSGLNLVDTIKTPIHGNSYIFILRRAAVNKNRVKNIIDLEAAYGLLNKDTYIAWESTVKTNMNQLIKTINEYRVDGYTLVGYGAAAKGNTLLNFGNIKLDFIIDDNPLKQGKFTPGTNCAIVSIDCLNDVSSDSKILFVPLAWNFFKEIKHKIQTVRTNSNDRFLRYFPNIEIN
jgi:2-polyprenyl-3-methyl-5-hydroxy-6-metoxy-1,4-benzoquinol methylase